MTDKEPIKFPKKMKPRPMIGREGIFICKCRHFTPESPPAFIPLVRIEKEGAIVVALRCAYCENEITLDEGKLPIPPEAFQLVEDPHSNDN